MKKRLRFLNTITKKNMIICTLFGVIILFVLSLVFPSMFYSLTKEDLSQHFSNTIRECSIRFSYILSNHQPTYRIANDKEAHLLIKDYYAYLDNDNIYNQIIKLLPIRSEGTNNRPGAIESVNFAMLATDRGDIFCNYEMIELAQHLTKTEWYKDLEGEQRTYSPILRLDYNGEEKEYFCFVSTFYVDDILCYSINLTEFEYFYNQMFVLEEMGMYDYMLVCAGNIIYQNLDASEIKLNDFSDDIDKIQYLTNKIENNDGYGYMVLCSYGQEDLSIAVNVPKEVILEPYNRIFTLFKVFCFILVIFMMMVACITFKISLKRLRKLSNQMNKVEGGNYDIVIRDNSNDEIGILSRTIHIMLEKIKNDIEQKVSYEKEKRQMQYSLLVSAIDPHFIYNTLDTITFLAAMNRCDEIITVNDALIGTLKDRLKMKSYKIFDSVEVEKQVLEQYMIIQNNLGHNKINLIFNVSAEDMKTKIPKNIIQPLVENAIKHGILSNKDENRINVKEGGTINVNVYSDENSITIHVSDNGSGIPDEILIKLNDDYSIQKINPEHIGIQNLKLRLNYLYKNNYTFKIESVVDKGTLITIILPKQSGKI